MFVPIPTSIAFFCSCAGKNYRKCWNQLRTNGGNLHITSSFFPTQSSHDLSNSCQLSFSPIGFVNKQYICAQLLPSCSTIVNVKSIPLASLDRNRSTQTSSNSLYSDVSNRVEVIHYLKSSNLLLLRIHTLSPSPLASRNTCHFPELLFYRHTSVTEI